MQAQNDAHAKKTAEDAAANVLNNVPGLEGNKDRQRFVIKVYTLVFMMLGVTTFWCFILKMDGEEGMYKWVLENAWLYYISLAVVIGISCGMACFYKRCREVPLNFVLLITYTIFHSYLIGALTT